MREDSFISDAARSKAVILSALNSGNIASVLEHVRWYRRLLEMELDRYKPCCVAEWGKPFPDHAH